MDIDAASYTPKDIPKYFRVAFDFLPISDNPPTTVKQLSQMKLVGVKGISSAGTIAMNWFGVARDGMLAMPGAKLITLNKLSRIMYDNPKYLMQDNMAALKRLFAGQDTAGVIHRVMEYAAAMAKKKLGRADIHHAMQYSAVWQSLASVARKQSTKFNTAEKLARWVMASIPEAVTSYHRDDLLKVDYKIWLRMIIEGLGEVGRVYSDEEEWVIKGETLKIPPRSTLYIMYPKATKEHIEMWADPKQRDFMRYTGGAHIMERRERVDELIKKFGLTRKFITRKVDPQKFDRQRAKYLTNRS